MAHFEIYILNYNGSRYLQDCLQSLRSLETGPHTYQVNVIDNGSSDDSCEFVARYFPEVNVIRLGANLGFSKGNNLGVAKRNQELRQLNRRADYTVFLNNDTAVEPGWLVHAAVTFEQDPAVGIVGSKSLFYDRFVVLRVSCDPVFVPAHISGTDTRNLGVLLNEPVDGVNLRLEDSRKKYIGAYPIEGNSRWLSNEATLYLPVLDPRSDVTVTLSLKNSHPHHRSQNITIAKGYPFRLAESLTLAGGTQQHITMTIPPSEFCTAVQNAGSYVTRNWEGGDIGFMEHDSGQYDAPRELTSVCGVSMFIKTAIFEQLNGFEPASFAYYEDTDLSLRARLKGWKCVYAPTSVLRHVHCGSGVEHSHYFNTNVTYSRLLLASKMMSTPDWWKLFLSYVKRARQEFYNFENDRRIEDKPFLRAIGRIIKHPILIVQNRLFAFINRPWRKLSKFLVD